MAKKKTNTKATKSKNAGKKVTPTKKRSKKSAIPKKNSAKKKPAQKKAAVKTKAIGKKTTGAKVLNPPKIRARKKRLTARPVTFSRESQGVRSAGQSGDLQGLSNVERADSESVDELLEEGNAFEADVVKGVEDAGNADEREVHTHEVPEDDVPGEYRDKD
jgi:hypothetical protein